MATRTQLKNKIQAVGNIKQMTRAMEMVAAAKMRRSQEAALAARPYAKKAIELLVRLKRYGTAHEVESPFWQLRGTGKVCLVVVTSDKGLAGSYNAQVLRRALREEEQRAAGKEVEIVAVGKKARDFFAKRHANLAEVFLKFSDIAALQDVSRLADWILAHHTDYEAVVFCSTQFVSALRQEVQLQQILPLQEEALSGIVEGIVPKTGRYADFALNERQRAEGPAQSLDYLVEPSPEAVLEGLMPDLVRVAVFHLVLEASASEHSSRMVAMKNATESAQDLQERLVLDLNKARQAAVTQEVSEISTAKEALTA